MNHLQAATTSPYSLRFRVLEPTKRETSKKVFNSDGFFFGRGGVRGGVLGSVLVLVNDSAACNPLTLQRGTLAGNPHRVPNQETIANPNRSYNKVRPMLVIPAIRDMKPKSEAISSTKSHELGQQRIWGVDPCFSTQVPFGSHVRLRASHLVIPWPAAARKSGFTSLGQKGCSVRGLRELRLQGLGVVGACAFNTKIPFLLRNSNSATTSRKPLPF